VIDDQPREVRLGMVWPSASRIALAGVGLAAVAPVLLPSTEGLLRLGSGPGGDGGDSVSISNPMVDIRRTLSRGDDLPLVQVRTSDPDPAYLRLTVLDTYEEGGQRKYIGVWRAGSDAYYLSVGGDF